MRVDFRSNIRAVERGLSDFAAKQVPFATSLALNATAEEIQKEESERLGKTLDRPTPFTRRAWAVWRSSKRNLSAKVFAKDAQAAYLSTLEDGGTRTPKGRAIVTPAGLKLNSFGNMPKGAVKKALASPRVFSGTPKGRAPGIYQRTGVTAKAPGGTGLVKLTSYIRRAGYKPTLGFKEEARALALRRMPHHFQAAMARALASARRS